MIETNFSEWDWAIVVVYLVASLGIGLIALRYIGRLSDFLVAGRKVRLALLIATMTGTEIGLVTLMYSAQEGFSRGMSAAYIGLIELIGYGLVGLTGFLVFRLRQEGFMTIPEFYNRRYNQRVRIVGALILVIAGTLNFGMFLRAGGQFLGGVTGTVSEVAINLIMTGMLVLVLAYTILGGMVSVVITDFIQFVVMSVGLVIATYFSLSAIGGWENLVQGGVEEKGIGFLNPLVQKDYGVSHAIWMILVTVSSATMWMPSVMRCLSAESPRQAKNVYLWSSITFMTRRVLPAVWGAAALVFIVKVADSGLRDMFFGGPEAEQLDTLLAMPIFLGKVIPTGILGLLVAGMLAGFMSTHDSYLLAFSGVITQDIVAPLRGREFNDRNRIVLTRVLILALGVFLLFWGIWFPLGETKTLWDYMALTGTIYFAGGLPVLVAGLYWRRASSRGAIAALLTGLVALAAIIDREWIIVGGQPLLPEWWTARNIGLTAFVLAPIMMVVFSLLFPDPKKAEGDSP